MAKSALQQKLEKQAEREAVLRESLINGKLKHTEYEVQQEENQGFEKLVYLVRSLSAVPAVRPIETFNRSLKTRDTGKIATAIAQHLYGKFRAPLYLTNAWNFIVKDEKKTDDNVVTVWQRRRRPNTVQDNISDKEINLYCQWYSVVASGGSLWKDYTRECTVKKSNIEYEIVPMFTKKENHSFLNCPIKDANVREAIIYAICCGHTNDIGVINRICKSKLARLPILSGNPIRFYTSRIWRETLHFFCVNAVTINELNDLLDYIQHAYTQNSEYSFKGRTLASLTKNMKDWHWELNRVKRMGNADWSANAVPIPNEEFILNSSPNTTWIMEQIVTSKALASEGTSMHHCVYSYQTRCVNGTTAIWSLKRKVEKKGWHTGIDR